MAKSLLDKHKDVLDWNVKVVNFLKTRPQRSCFLKIPCQEIWSLPDKLLLHTEVQWLSREM